MNKIAEKLFGSTTQEGKLIRAKGDFEISYEELKAPFEHNEGVIKFFCQGCGSCYEPSIKMAEKIAKKANIILPKNLADFYFESAGCDVCDGDKTKVKIKKI